MQNRCVPFERAIDRRSIERLLRNLRQVGAPRHVYISSPGGRFEFFSSMAPAIERQGIITLSGDVRSAAVILFLLGRYRQAFPDSTFFFHEVRTLVGSAGEITLTDIEEVAEYEDEMSGQDREFHQEWRRQMKAAQDWFVAFMASKTGIPAPTFLNLMRSEATLSARDAMRYGIVVALTLHRACSEQTQ